VAIPELRDEDQVQKLSPTSSLNADVPVSGLTCIPIMVSEPRNDNSDKDFVLDITDHVFCNPEPILCPAMHCHADIPEVLVKQSLSVGVLPAYSPTCPIRTVLVGSVSSKRRRCHQPVLHPLLPFPTSLRYASAPIVYHPRSPPLDTAFIANATTARSKASQVHGGCFTMDSRKGTSERRVRRSCG